MGSSGGGIGGSFSSIGRTIRRGTRKVAAQAKRTKAEDVLSLGTAPISRKIHEKTGLKLDVLAPAAWLAGEVGELAVDKPKQEKKEARAAEARTAAEQKKILAQVETEEAQMESEEEAGEARSKARGRQRRRSKGRGRKSTILAEDTTAQTGATPGGRKTLLGL